MKQIADTVNKIARMIVPMVLTCVLCFSKSSKAQLFEQNGDTVRFHGSTIKLCTLSHPDMALRIDYLTGKEYGNVTWNHPIPCKLNGMEVYRTGNLTQQPQPAAGNLPVREYLHDHLLADIESLPDGTYALELINIVIDTMGHVAYYDLCCIRYVREEGASFPGHDSIAVERENNIYARLSEINQSLPYSVDSILHTMPSLSPGKISDRAVAVFCDNNFYAVDIVLKDHKATVRRRYQ